MNIVLFDFNVDDSHEFIEGLNKYTHIKWYSMGCPSNGRLYSSGLGNILRFIKYFLFPFRLLTQLNRFKTIIAWQQFYGLNLAFWQRLLHLKKRNNLIVLTFIYKKKGGFIGYCYHCYISYIVKSKYIDLLVCFSEFECEYYSELFNLDRGKFSFIRLGNNKNCLDDLDICNKGYIFSTGRSNRDYDFLVEAVEKMDYKLFIACDTYNYASEKIQVDTNCFGDKMIRKMAEAFCVVIPLKDTQISSGQLVILQAFELGKPVIVTDSRGVSDYIINEENGFIIPKHKDALQSILKRLSSDKLLYEQISRNARMYFLENYSLDSMASDLAEKLGQIS